MPLQPLYLLNSEYVVARAQAFARRVQERAGKDQQRQVEVCFELALGRSPDAKERELARDFLTGAALVHLCHAMMNLNEFVYVE